MAFRETLGGPEEFDSAHAQMASALARTDDERRQATEMITAIEDAKKRRAGGLD